MPAFSPSHRCQTVSISVLINAAPAPMLSFAAMIACYEHVRRYSLMVLVIAAALLAPWFASMPCLCYACIWTSASVSAQVIVVLVQFKQRLEALVGRGGAHPKMVRLQASILAHLRGQDPIADVDSIAAQNAGAVVKDGSDPCCPLQATQGCISPASCSPLSCIVYAHYDLHTRLQNFNQMHLSCIHSGTAANASGLPRLPAQLQSTALHRLTIYLTSTTAVTAPAVHAVMLTHPLSSLAVRQHHS